MYFCNSRLLEQNERKASGTKSHPLEEELLGGQAVGQEECY